MSNLSKFQSLCEEVIDLDHLRESGGKQVRVRPSFHEELERLGQELDRAQNDMFHVLNDVEKESKVRGPCSSKAELCGAHWTVTCGWGVCRSLSCCPFLTLLL